MKKTAALSLVLAALTVAAAAADVLVTQAGDKIETKGPWKVKGRTVIFTSPAGVLSSVRLSEIDLEASAAATEEASNPPPVAVPPPPQDERPRLPVPPKNRPTQEAVLTITNKDVGTARSARIGALDFDLGSFDEGTRKVLVDELYNVGRQIARLHKDHDLTTEEGIRRAAGSLQQMARQARARAQRAKGESSRRWSSSPTGWRRSPNRLATLRRSPSATFYDMPPREDLTEGGLQALDSATGRKAFEEELKAQGGGD